MNAEPAPGADIRAQRTARLAACLARDPERAVVLIDPKGPLAELCLGLAPETRTVHFLDLGHPEFGINPLQIDARPGVRRGRIVNKLTGDASEQLHERHDASDFELRTQDKLETVEA